MSGDVTALLQRVRNGEAEATESLLPLVMAELRNLAAHYLRGERQEHTLQPTALVNEAYLRLVDLDDMDWQNRAHFIGVTANLMRRVLVDYSRKTRARKRSAIRTDEFDFNNLAAPNGMSPEIVLALDRALDSLHEMSPRQSRIVEMRYFGGLSIEETSEVLKLSPITVKRDWLAARAWLRSQLQSQRDLQ